jgi:hypothetical protein
MKKTNLKNKLELRRTTVRVLSAAQLLDVVGGLHNDGRGPKPDITSERGGVTCTGSSAAGDEGCGTKG